MYAGMIGSGDTELYFVRLSWLWPLCPASLHVCDLRLIDPCHEQSYENFTDLKFKMIFTKEPYSNRGRRIKKKLRVWHVKSRQNIWQNHKKVGDGIFTCPF